jgi:hypothetical protein
VFSLAKPHRARAVTEQPQTDLEALRQRAIAAAEPGERVGAYKALGAVKPADAAIKRFLRQRAAADRDRLAALAAIEALLRHDAEDAETLRFARHWTLADDEISVRPRLVPGGEREPQPRPDAAAEGENGYDWPKLRADTLALLFDACRYDRDMMCFVAERAAEDPDPGLRRRLIEALARAGESSQTLLRFVMSRAVDDPDPHCRAAIYTQLAAHCGKKLEVREFLRQRAEQDLEFPAQPSCALALIEVSGQEAESWRVIRRVVTSAPDRETQRIVFKAAAENNARTQDTRDLIYHVALRFSDNGMRLDALEAVVRSCRQDPKVWPLLERLIELEAGSEIGAAAKKALTQLRR